MPSDIKTDVLVIDDETQIRRLLRFMLEDVGYSTREAASGQAGLNEAAARKPDLVILDLGLPDQSGVEVLRQLREWLNVPILILSVVGEERQKVAALDAGADDYLTKPFGESELLARLRVLLRRVNAAPESEPIRFGSVEVDMARRLVMKGQQPVRLTVKEYALLRLFISHRGKALTHRYILSELWGPKSDEQTHYLHVYMTRLRQKLEDEPDEPRFFQTEAGVGYRFLG